MGKMNSARPYSVGWGWAMDEQYKMIMHRKNNKVNNIFGALSDKLIPQSKIIIIMSTEDHQRVNRVNCTARVINHTVFAVTDFVITQIFELSLVITSAVLGLKIKKMMILNRCHRGCYY